MDDSHDNCAVAATVAELRLFNHHKAADMMGELWWSLQQAEAMVHDIAAVIDRDGGQMQNGDSGLPATAKRVIEKLATERNEAEVREHLARSERNQALARLDALRAALESAVDQLELAAECMAGEGMLHGDELESEQRFIAGLRAVLNRGNVNETIQGGGK